MKRHKTPKQLNKEYKETQRLLEKGMSKKRAIESSGIASSTYYSKKSRDDINDEEIWLPPIVRFSKSHYLGTRKMLSHNMFAYVQDRDAFLMQCLAKNKAIKKSGQKSNGGSDSNNLPTAKSTLFENYEDNVFNSKSKLPRFSLQRYDNIVKGRVWDPYKIPNFYEPVDLMIGQNFPAIWPYNFVKSTEWRRKVQTYYQRFSRLPTEICFEVSMHYDDGSSASQTHFIREAYEIRKWQKRQIDKHYIQKMQRISKENGEPEGFPEYLITSKEAVSLEVELDQARKKLTSPNEEALAIRMLLLKMKTKRLQDSYDALMIELRNSLEDVRTRFFFSVFESKQKPKPAAFQKIMLEVDKKIAIAARDSSHQDLYANTNYLADETFELFHRSFANHIRMWDDEFDEVMPLCHWSEIYYRQLVSHRAALVIYRWNDAYAQLIDYPEEETDFDYESSMDILRKPIGEALVSSLLKRESVFDLTGFRCMYDLTKYFRLGIYSSAMRDLFDDDLLPSKIYF